MPSTHDTRALGNATAALAGLDVYTSTAIPGWNPSILVAGMMSGTIFRMPLAGGTEPPQTYFKAQDRYRDLAIAPDGRRIYAVTDAHGRVTDGRRRADGVARALGRAARVHVRRVMKAVASGLRIQHQRIQRRVAAL